MKPFAIIIDESLVKRVVPSKWLNDDFDKISWPPVEDVNKIRKMVINLADVGDDWETYPITRFIKLKDDYNEAIDDIKKNLDDATDGSDLEALRKSRSKRSRKLNNSDEHSKSKKSRLEVVDSSSSSNVSEEEEIAISTVHAAPPPSLSINISNKQVNEKDAANKKATKNTPKSSSLRDGEVAASSDNENLPSSHNSDGPMLPNNNNNESSVTQKSKKNLTTINNEEPSSFDLIGMEIPHFENPVEGIKLLFGMQKKILQNVHKVSMKVDTLNTLVSKTGRPTRNTQNISAEIVKKMTDYFPVDEEMKKIASVERKLKNPEFFDGVETITLGWKDRMDLQGSQLTYSVSFMETKGGHNAHEMVYNILATIATDKVLSCYSFFGTKTKGRFSSLLLCSCIYHAVKNKFSNTTDDDIKKSLKMRLDTAKTRVNRLETEAPKKRNTFVPVVPIDAENLGSSDEEE